MRATTDFPKFLLKLINRFAGLDEEVERDLSVDLLDDWKAIEIDKTNPRYKEPKGLLQKFKFGLKLHTSDVWVRIGIWLGYIGLCKYIPEWMEPTQSDEKAEEMYELYEKLREKLER